MTRFSNLLILYLVLIITNCQTPNPSSTRASAVPSTQCKKNKIL